MQASDPRKAAQPQRTHTLHKPRLKPEAQPATPCDNIARAFEPEDNVRTQPRPSLKQHVNPLKSGTKPDRTRKTPPEGEHTRHITNKPQHLCNYITWNLLRCVINSTNNQANQVQHPWLRKQQSTPTSARLANNHKPAASTPARRGYTRHPTQWGRPLLGRRPPP
jgi:hypothetical protein